MAIKASAGRTTEVRLLEFGLRHLWDTSGGDHTRAWFDAFSPQLYNFNQLAYHRKPQLGVLKVGRGKKGSGKRRGPGQAPVKQGLEGSFRFEPIGLRGGATKKQADEYVRKRLFTWALHYDTQGTADLVGHQLPTYESTKRDGGPPPGAPQLSPLKKQIKFFWGMMRHHRETVDDSGGHPSTPLQKDFGLSAAEAGKGFKAPRILPTQDSFLATYQRKAVTELNFGAKQLADDGLRDLMGKLATILTIDPAARKTLSADSAEELGLRILRELEAGMPILTAEDAPLAVQEAIGRVRAGLAFGERPRDTMLDIEPKMTDALDAIEASMIAANQGRRGGSYTRGPGSTFDGILADMRKRGIEVSEVGNRLSQIYRINATSYGGIIDYQEALIDKIQEDVYSAYQHGGISQMKLGPEGVDMHGIGTQFFHKRGVGIDTAGGYVWSSRAKVPGGGGMFFFSIWKPAVLNSAEDVSVVGMWLPITPTLWRNALERSTVRNFSGAIQRSVVSALDGAITTTAGQALHVNALGTEFGRQMSKGFARGDPSQRITTPGYLYTRVTIQPTGEVVNEIAELIEAAAVKYGEMISIAGPQPSGTPSFTHWVMSQERAAEKMAQKMDSRLSKDWKSWVYKLGGKYKPQPFKAAEDKWPQPVHPRPYLWMTAQHRR